MDFIILAFAFILGLIVGSFLNVVVLRLPKHKSILGRSQCPHCHYQLQPKDLVPVFSYLFLRGRCRNCRAVISPRYILIELCTGLLFAGAFWFYGAPLSASDYITLLYMLVSISIAVVVFVIDLEHYLILDKVVIASSVCLLVLLVLHDTLDFQGFLDSATFSGLLGALIGVVLIGGIWFFTRGRAMGFGDVKYMIPFGLSLGFPNVIVGLFLAFTLGALAALPLLFLGNKTLKSKVPFGTFLSVSLVITQFFGSFIVTWYLSLTGLG